MKKGGEITNGLGIYKDRGEKTRQQGTLKQKKILHFWQLMCITCISMQQYPETLAEVTVTSF